MHDCYIILFFLILGMFSRFSFGNGLSANAFIIEITCVGFSLFIFSVLNFTFICQKTDGNFIVNILAMCGQEVDPPVLLDLFIPSFATNQCTSTQKLIKPLKGTVPYTGKTFLLQGSDQKDFADDRVCTRECAGVVSVSVIQSCAPSASLKFRTDP